MCAVVHKPSVMFSVGKKANSLGLEGLLQSFRILVRCLDKGNVQNLQKIHILVPKFHGM